VKGKDSEQCHIVGRHQVTWLIIVLEYLT